MRKQRILAQGVWYEVRTVINDYEPLFREQQREKALLFRLLIEVKKMFTFEMRGFALEGERLSFYIKSADGFLLPRIMQWLKQTFAVRFNLRTGRMGHRWGDRYWSEVLEGEPPEGAAAVDWEAMEAEAETPTAAEAEGGQTPSGGKRGGNPVFTRNPPPRRLSSCLRRGKAPL